MNVERDKFLTKQMGKCWHESGPGQTDCKYCRRSNDPRYFDFDTENRTFSSWSAFGKLKDFMCKLPDAEAFFDSYIDKLTLHADEVAETFNRLQPDHFADAAYEYLQERENDI